MVWRVIRAGDPTGSKILAPHILAPHAKSMHPAAHPGGREVDGMELHQIRYFLTACDTLNFTRAAEQCGVSVPSLSG